MTTVTARSLVTTRFVSWTPLTVLVPAPSGYTRALDTDGTAQPWVFKTGSQFARSYGMTHPVEDFATCFAALFMQEAGWMYAGDSGSGNITAKLNYIDQYIV